MGIRYIKCSICAKTMRRLPHEENDFHVQCASKLKSKKLCTICKKSIGGKSVTHVKCSKKKYVPRGIELPTVSQQDCIDRQGKCWAFDGRPACLHGRLIEHTNCKLNCSKVVRRAVGPAPEFSKEWHKGWEKITALSLAEEELHEVVDYQEREFTVDEHIRLGDLKKERTRVLNKVHRRADAGE